MSSTICAVPRQVRWHAAPGQFAFVGALLVVLVAAAKADVPDKCLPVPEPKSASDECALPLAKADVKVLLACAGKAQDQVRQLRSDLEGLYDEINLAAQRALTLKLEESAEDRPTAAKVKGSTAPLTRRELVSCAPGMQQRAQHVRELLGKAQDGANRFVDASLVVKQKCGSVLPEDCAEKDAIEEARRRHEELVNHIGEARAEHAFLRELALHLQVYSNWSGGSAVEALRFARLMRDFPDAKSLLGEDAYFVSAGTKDSTAALRLSKTYEFFGALRRVSAVVSTPLGDNKEVKLYSRADGLAGTTQVTVSSELFKGKPSKALLSLFSVGLTAGREERTYIADDVAPKEEKVRVYPLAVTLTSALFDAEGDNRNTHVAKFGWQRTHDDAEKVIRCPVPAVGVVFVTCLQGALGAPKRTSAGVLSYQYRGVRQSFAAAPQVSYNTHSKVVDLEAPIYLVRSSDDKERPFNAGISFGWATKGKTSVTERTGSEFRVSVFIGAPFSLVELGR